MDVPLSKLDLCNFYSMPITTLTLYSGWDADSTSRELCRAAAALLEKNPPLSGRLIPPQSGGPAYVQVGVHQDPVVVLPEMSGYTLPATLPERLKDLFNLIGPSLHAAAGGTSIGTGRRQFAEGSRLFQIVVLPLSGGLACVRVQLSHILGDAACYFRVLAALHAELAGEEPVAIRWGQTGDPPPAQPHPPQLPKWRQHLRLAALRARSRAHFLDMFKSARVGNIALTDLAALEKCKAAAGAHAAEGFVSKNDVISAALSEAIGLGCLGQLYVNLRGRLPHSHVTSEHGGNYNRGIHFPCREAGHREKGPAFVRDVLLRKLVYYDKEPIPAWPFVTDQQGSFNSWTAITKLFVPKGTAVLAHCPGRSHIDTVKTDHALVFMPQPGAAPAILHNFLIHSWGFRARARASTWWQRVVSAEAIWPQRSFKPSSLALLLAWLRRGVFAFAHKLPFLSKLPL